MGSTPATRNIQEQPTNTLLQNTISSSNVRKIERPRCKICRVRFKSRVELRAHEQQVHPELSASNATDLSKRVVKPGEHDESFTRVVNGAVWYDCKYCNKTVNKSFRSIEERKAHVKTG